MSAFCVYGVTPKVAYLKAYNAYKLDLENAINRKVYEETLNKITKLSNKNYNEMQPVRISGEFSSLKIAQEFIDLLIKTEKKYREIKIMVKMKKRLASGRVDMKNATEPKRHWVDYEGQTSDPD